MVSALQYFVAYLIVDVLCAVLTVIIASTVSRDSGTETQVRYLFLVLTAFLVFVVFDAVWAFLNYSGLVVANDVLLSIVNGINLTAISFDAYFWLCFILSRFGSEVTDNRSLRALVAIPALLVPVIHIVGFFTGQNVIFLPDGSLSYGICHTAIVCIQLLYIVAATAVATHRYRRATTHSKRRESLVFVSFMVPFVVAGIIDTLIAGTPVASAGIIVSLVFVMMSIQESRISSDALTGLNNRRRANEYLENSISHVSSGHPLYLFIIDLDDFKAINDTFGHLEGDHAIKLAADALRIVCAQTNAFAARWGGDEFVIICTELSDNDPARVSEGIGNELAYVMRNAHVNYDLTCSIGYATCNSPEEDCSHLVSDADKMLYDVKRAHHNMGGNA